MHSVLLHSSHFSRRRQSLAIYIPFTSLYTYKYFVVTVPQCRGLVENEENEASSRTSRRSGCFRRLTRYATPRACDTR